MRHTNAPPIHPTGRGQKLLHAFSTSNAAHLSHTPHGQLTRRMESSFTTHAAFTTTNAAQGRTITITSNTPRGPTCIAQHTKLLVASQHMSHTNIH